MSTIVAIVLLNSLMIDSSVASNVVQSSDGRGPEPAPQSTFALVWQESNELASPVRARLSLLTQSLIATRLSDDSENRIS